MFSLSLATGQKMPVLGFGTWQIADADASGIVQTALKVGYRHIDTAAIYENEKGVGEALAASGIPRQELFVTTKVWKDDYRAADLPRGVDASLQRLKLDFVDLLLLHWPIQDVPLAETLGALNEVALAGKTRAIGVSNFPVKLMEEALSLTTVPIVTNQIEYHALLSQKSVIQYARAHDIVITAYSPLAHGRLRDHPLLVRIGSKYGKTAAQVALRWLVEQEGVAVIPKASSEANMRANLEIFDFALDAEERSAIDGLANNTRVVSPPWAPEWDID